jgi:hypothetical protein
MRNVQSRPSSAGRAAPLAACLERFRIRGRRWCDQRGVALVVALMSLILLTILGLALVLTTSTETMIASNFSAGQEALYAADSAVELAVQDLLTVSDWNTLLAGTTVSAFIDGPPSGDRTLPGGNTLNLMHLLNTTNCGKKAACSAADMDAVTAERPWRANNPRWQMYAYGGINDMIPTRTINSLFYVVVMVADDPAETDDDPTKDANGVIAMRAEAFGPGNSHKLIMVTLARTDATEHERGYVGQRGQDEQNRRAHGAAVQTPGKSLDVGEFSIATGGKMVM